MKRSDVLDIKRLRNEGLTNEEIAEIKKVTPVTIARWVKKLREAGHEVKRFPRGRKPLVL